MIPFWEGALAGYGIAIPVGVIAILIVETGLRQGFFPAFMAGAGAASADLIYAALAAAAGEAISAILAPYAGGLQIASALVLLGLGGSGLWQIGRSARKSSLAPKPVDGRSPGAVYLQFLGLTLLNPLTVAYFGALILGSRASLLAATADRAVFVAGAALASLSWQTFLAGMGAVANQRLPARIQVAAGVAGNLVVAGLGGRMMIQALAGG